jgi:MSHA biogenesis protein MshL
MAVRAMPEELRQVEKFLKAAQVAVERQVMLEAKIVEVELNDGFQSGVDWHALRNSGTATGVMGSVGGGTANNILINGVVGNVPGFPSGALSALGGAVSLPTAGGGLFGLALAADGFQAVLGFLETRGDIQILSSPRIATLNNQKALLKVGTDEFFVTGFTSNTTTTTTTSGTAGNPTLSPITPVISSMFSGIALDVTPQIDDANNITLHVRPSVTSISEKSKSIGLSTGPLPLASRSVNESDTMVRIQDGNIVAIGGLMQMESNRSASGLPNSTNVPFFSSLLGNKASSGRKKELVVLIKPTIIRNAEDWEAQTRRSRAALDDMDATRARIVRLDGGGIVQLDGATGK